MRHCLRVAEGALRKWKKSENEKRDFLRDAPDANTGTRRDTIAPRASYARQSIKRVRRSLAFASCRLYNRPSLSSASHRKAINHPGTGSTARLDNFYECRMPARGITRREYRPIEAEMSIAEIDRLTFLACRPQKHN